MHSAQQMLPLIRGQEEIERATEGAAEDAKAGPVTGALERGFKK